MRATELADYQATLGKLLGTRLYDAIAPLVTPDKILGYGSQAIDDLVRGLRAQLTHAQQEQRFGQVNLVPVADQLQPILKKYAEQLLHTKEGQALARALSQWIGTHPLEIAIAAVLAGAGAVATNMKIPTLSDDVKLGKHLTVGGGLDIGHLRALALEGVEAHVKLTTAHFSTEASLHEQKNGEQHGRFGLTATTAHAGASAIAQVDQVNGQLKIKLDSDFHVNPDSTKDGLLTIDGIEHHVGGGVHFDPGSKTMQVSLTDTLFQHVTDGAGHQSQGRQLLAVALNEAFTPTGDTLTAGLNTTLPGKVALGASVTDGPGSNDSVNATVNKTTAFGVTLGAEATLAKLNTFGARFGYTNPKEFESYLLDYHHKETPTLPLHEFAFTVEQSFHRVLGRAQGTFSISNGQATAGMVGLTAAVPTHGIYALGGVEQGLDAKHSTTVGIGAQIHDIPVMVKYDVDQKKWSVAIVAPFGRKKK